MYTVLIHAHRINNKMVTPEYTIRTACIVCGATALIIRGFLYLFASFYFRAIP